MQSGALVAMDSPKPIKSISAVKKYDRAKKNNGGANVRYKRMLANIDEAVAKFGTNPAVVRPIARLYMWKHFTESEAMAAYRYGDIMRKFDRYHGFNKARTPQAQSFEPMRGGEDQELQRRANDGTIGDYEKAAKAAKKQYLHLMKIVSRYQFAKDVLDNLCVLEIEPPSEWRGQISLILSVIAKEFGLTKPNRRGKR
jgi:hypothetical protein